MFTDSDKYKCQTCGRVYAVGASGAESHKASYCSRKCLSVGKQKGALFPRVEPRGRHADIHDILPGAD